MKLRLLPLLAIALAGCVSTDAPAPASYAPLPVQYGPGMRAMDPMIGAQPYPIRSQVVNMGNTPYYVNEAHGVATVTPGVLQPLRPVTLQPLN